MAETITFNDLVATHGATDARRLWSLICAAGGFGNVAPDNSGGLDCAGLPPAAQKQIELLTKSAVKPVKPANTGDK